MLNNVRVCDVCKTKLFAIVRERKFYCRKCQLYIVALDRKGNRIGPGSNPIITEEQIKAIKKSIIAPLGTKVVYKLITRPLKGAS